MQVAYRSYPAKLKLATLDARRPSAITFQRNGRTTDVASYLKELYCVTLQHPDWPCVKTSTGACIPLELCRYSVRGTSSTAFVWSTVRCRYMLFVSSTCFGGMSCVHCNLRVRQYVQCVVLGGGVGARQNGCQT